MSGTLTRIKDEADPVLTQFDLLTREQIREDATDEEDDLWDAYLAAAVEQVEKDSRRVFTPQTWRLSLDEYPCGAIEVRRSPLVSVDAFEVKNADGDWETVDPDSYEVDTESEPARIVKAKSGVWPAPYPRTNGIRITLTLGYATPPEIPEIAKQAIRFLVGHWYRNRSPVSMGGTGTEIPLTYQNLITRLKW